MQSSGFKLTTSALLVLTLGLSGAFSASAESEIPADPQTLLFEMTPTVTTTGTRVDFDFPDDYYSKFIQIQYGVKIASGLTLYKTFDRFALEAPDGKMSIDSPIKLKKGQVLRVRIGARFVKAVTIQ
jgi:hypothetical protein